MKYHSSTILPETVNVDKASSVPKMVSVSMYYAGCDVSIIVISAVI